MTLLDYIKQASTTAIYPGAGTATGMGYVMFGACGEIGECFEVVKKIIRDDEGKISAKRERLLKELGDVCWYLSQIISESGIKLDIFDYALEDLQNPVVLPDDLSDSELLGYIGNSLIQIHFAASENLHLYTKMCTEEDKVEFNAIMVETCKSCVNILESVIRIILILNSNLEEVLQNNLDKLSARKDAGKLQGSGENLDER